MTMPVRRTLGIGAAAVVVAFVAGFALAGFGVEQFAAYAVVIALVIATATALAVRDRLHGDAPSDGRRSKKQVGA